MTNLYYTVEKETQTIDTIEECTGFKNVTVYEIANDKPKKWFDVDTTNNVSSISEIENWLNDNGFGERKYNFIQL